MLTVARARRPRLVDVVEVIVTVVASILIAAPSTTTRAQDASPVVSMGSSRLDVHVPTSLYRESGYDHREALFGLPPYNGEDEGGLSIKEYVYYADNDLCSIGNEGGVFDYVVSKGGYPERKIVNGTMRPWEPPFILMVDRGGCTFVTKVRNAQRFGAAAVIIADNTCLCKDPDCISSDPCEVNEPILADDGSGGDITIPSFFMFKQDADKVKNELLQNRPVQIEMSWNVGTINPDGRVELEIWTFPKDPVSEQFFFDFRDWAVALGDSVLFTPHVYIYDGVRTGCLGTDGENLCYNLCTNNGRYCATDPDDNLELGTSGADIVTESLRRICIWNNHGVDDGVGTVWWDYVIEFDVRCGSDPDFFVNATCVRDAYEHAKVDGDRIAQCMLDSGGLEGNSTNTLLEDEITLQVQRSVVLVPSIFINGVPFRGSFSANNVFAGVCAGFRDGTAPNICVPCGNCTLGDPDCVQRCNECGPGYVGDDCTIPVEVCAGPVNPDNNSPDCLNGGVCVQHDNKTTWGCMCPAGFVGYQCEIQSNLCPWPGPPLSCLNGGVCVAVDETNSTSRWICDCTSTAHAGLNCEYPATSYCEKTDEAFCTNNGICAEVVQPGEPHAGCMCPEEFEGPRCEFLIDTSAPSSPTAIPIMNNNGNTTIADSENASSGTFDPTFTSTMTSAPSSQTAIPTVNDNDAENATATFGPTLPGTMTAAPSSQTASPTVDDNSAATVDSENATGANSSCRAIEFGRAGRMTGLLALSMAILY